MRRLAPERLWFASLLGLAPIVGTVARARQYFSGRSLWLDEASLALNIEHRGFAGLLRPLDYGQAAPIGFLWLERACVDVLGNGEMALRLVPFATSLGTLALSIYISCRLLGWAAPIAVWLVALSPGLVYYSNELKQYSSDTFWVAAVVASTIMLLRLASPVRLAAWGLVGLAAVWSSQPALLALGVAGPVVLATTLRRRSWRTSAAVAGIGAAWLVAFGAEWVISLRALSQDAYFRTYWILNFPPNPVTPRGLVAWSLKTAVSYLNSPAGFVGWIALPALVLGMATLVRRLGWPGFLIAAIPVSAWLIAVVGQYPFGDRVTLFALPMVIVLLASLSLWTRPKPRVVGAIPVIGVVLLGLGPALQTGSWTISPLRHAENRPTYQFVADHWQVGDGLYLHAWAGPTYLYYAPILHVAPADGMFDYVRSSSCVVESEIAPIEAHRRTWIVFNLAVATEPPSYQAFYLSRFERAGTVIASYGDGESAAYLLDTSRAADPTGAMVLSWPGHQACVGYQPPPH